MAKSVKQLLKFPFAGRNSNFGYESMPEGTTVDCLNVLPFDPRGSRLRGGQRAGTAKVTAAALGGGADVACLHQSVRPARDALRGKTIWQDDFPSATVGMEIGDFGGMGRGAYWTAAENLLYSNYVGSSGNNPAALTLSANRLWRNGGHVSTNLSTLAAALVNPAYLFPKDKFEVSGNWFLAAGSGSPLYEHWLYAKAQRPISSSQSGIKLVFDRGVMYLTGMPGSYAGVNGHTASYSFPQLLPTNVQTEFTLRIDGNILTGLCNGVVRVQVQTDMSTLANQDGVGFGVAGYVGQADAGLKFFRVRELPTPAVSRKTFLIAVASGSIYVGESPDSLAPATNGESALTAGNAVSAGDLDGYVYFVDSVSAKRMSLQTLEVEEWTTEQYPDFSSKGTVPPNLSHLCVWRTRIVVSDGDNVFMSRCGNPRDFDYSQDDAQAAVAFNPSSSHGQIGQPIQALIPFRDDGLLIGCDRSLFLVDGDPADGGSVITVSESVGILGKDAFCQDPAGNIYFVGTGGLYRMQAQPGSQPVNLSTNSEASFFADIDRGVNYLAMVWDRDREGCWIFVTSKTTGACRHYWFDATSSGGGSEGGAFFPQQFPDNHGPVAALLYDGNGPLDRYLLLGGRDGHIRKHSVDCLSDDGQPIVSAVSIGPFRPGGVVQQGRLTDLEFYLGELPAGLINANWNLHYTVQSAKDAYAAFISPRCKSAGRFTAPGRQLHRRQRQLGGVFFIKLWNDTLDTTWTLEQIVAGFEPAGMVR